MTSEPRRLSDGTDLKDELSRHLTTSTPTGLLLDSPYSSPPGLRPRKAQYPQDGNARAWCSIVSHPRTGDGNPANPRSLSSGMRLSVRHRRRHALPPTSRSPHRHLPAPAGPVWIMLPDSAISNQDRHCPLTKRPGLRLVVITSYLMNGQVCPKPHSVDASIFVAPDNQNRTANVPGGSVA